MISTPKNRVQEIKSRFENLSSDRVTKNSSRLHKGNLIENAVLKEVNDLGIIDYGSNTENNENESEICREWPPKPNSSYLYKPDVKRSLSDTKNTLSRQSSDPGKKLHRSHAFRCDKSQKINHSPKRHGSCYGRSETSDFTVKMERKLPEDKRKLLTNFLEEQMRRENFVPETEYAEIVGVVQDMKTNDSVPDSKVPQHILEQYAIVVKPKKKETDKQDTMTDSGVSSETENVEDDKNGRIKKLMTQFEQLPDKTATNLKEMDKFSDSSETIRLVRKNPHIIFTETIKKALKQPLPAGPPPQKPPRIFKNPATEPLPEEKQNAKRMLQKLEQVLKKREENTLQPVKQPKEVHYLCTEILDITNRTLLPNQSLDPISKCLNSLNCAITNDSMSSLPYTRLKSDNLNTCSRCSNDFNVNYSNKCEKCLANDEKHDRFKCHCNCKCVVRNSEFYVGKEHIYDVPCSEDGDRPVKRNLYGTLNSLKSCKSMEELRFKNEGEQMYDIPFTERPNTPDIPLNTMSNHHTQEPETETKSQTRKPLEFTTEITSKDETTKSEINPKVETTKSEINSKVETSNSKFELLRQNFENGFPSKVEKKPVTLPKPILVSKLRQKSVENLNGGCEGRRGKREGSISFTVPRRDAQLDLDRENLNCLMNELSETVTAVCKMDDNKPTSFPTEFSDSSTSEESVKRTRSLTEQRKNYVRRVSTRVAYLDPKNIKRFRNQTSICSYKSDVIDKFDNPYSTFRSWKSFRTSHGNISKMDAVMDSKINLTDSKGNILSMKDVLDSNSESLSIDEKTGCIDLPLEPREAGLFNMCLLVGLNYMTGEAYVKSVFPSQVPVPPHIENLVFPETMSACPAGEWAVDAKSWQCYSLVLTDERGERAYGYCRRVLPEGASTCLPLCYCLIGRYRAPGFYYKVLEEIESHHGRSDVEIHSLLQQLYDSEFPCPGQEVTVQCSLPDTVHIPSEKISPKSKTMPDMRHSDKMADVSLSDYYDIENNNNNNGKSVTLQWELPRIKRIKRPIEPRFDEDNLSVLLDLLGPGLVIKVFASLLLERKLVIIGDKLRSVSSCIEALQSALYPFVWQQPLISSIPAEIQREVLEAPLPILAGMLHTATDAEMTGLVFEEGMLIDLTHPSKVLYYQGDESTILPTPCYKLLKTSLNMETSRHKDAKSKATGNAQEIDNDQMRNVMISEAFLRFFVDILGDFWQFFKIGEVKDGLGKAGVSFDKDAFIKNSSSKQNQYFLEWFTETAMFTHFIQNMAVSYHHHGDPNTPINPQELVDTPLPNFYELFNDRVKSRNNSKNKSLDSGKSNYKNAVNKKVKYLKSKLRDLVA